MADTMLYAYYDGYFAENDNGCLKEEVLLSITDATVYCTANFSVIKLIVVFFLICTPMVVFITDCSTLLKEVVWLM